MASYVQLMKQGSIKPVVDAIGGVFVFNCGLHACASTSWVPWGPDALPHGSMAQSVDD